jgi:DNA invertase Pin-like site-specific DNA recombinase
MVRNINKTRLNEMRLEISDATPHNVQEPNRTRRRKKMLVGYARTSTSDQTAGLDAQQRDLTAAGCERVFSEQVSSVAQRTKLAECLRFLRQGDVLTVVKPDRLARSTAELLAIEADLSKRGIGLVVLSMGGERLDTRNPTSKLMLTILAGVATWEREVMLERQREGIAKAKGEGKYKGRKPTVGLRADVIRKMRADDVGPAKIARELGVARSSVYRMLETPEIAMRDALI